MIHLKILEMFQQNFLLDICVSGFMVKLFHYFSVLIVFWLCWAVDPDSELLSTCFKKDAVRCLLCRAAARAAIGSGERNEDGPGGTLWLDWQLQPVNVPFTYLHVGMDELEGAAQSPVSLSQTSTFPSPPSSCSVVSLSQCPVKSNHTGV